MAIAQVPPIYNELLDYLIEKATPEEILAFKVSESAQVRADDLTDKNKSGTLTADESAELSQMLEFDMLVTVLKAKALEALSNS